MFDCLVVGAGPAGLTAALYMARYRRSVLVAHDGTSRALRAPLAHNLPGFPDGVAGEQLISNMQVQAERFGARIERRTIREIHPTREGFEVAGEGASYACRTVILATGVKLNEVDLPRAEHDAAMRAGCLRYCPVCDGFEAREKAIGVLGCDPHGAAEALFLRRYSDRVSLIPLAKAELSPEHRRQLEAAGVAVVEAAVARLRPDPDGMTVEMRDGSVLRFDVLYPALGCKARSELADGLALARGETGGVETDQGQRTPVAGLFAAGDLVEGLDQISVAIGQGAIAATKAHNHLREQDGEMLRR